MHDHPSQDDAVQHLDAYISPELRGYLEQQFYRQVEQQAELARVIGDPDFLARPDEHVALFADHGIAHVRDVAARTLHVLDAVHGRLIAARPPSRLAFMRGLGVALAYVHDIGMAEPGQQGRAMHPEFVVQAALGATFDQVVSLLLADDRGQLVQHLGSERMLRETLATAMAHSKSKVPTAALCDPTHFRTLLQDAAQSDLGWLYERRRKGEKPKQERAFCESALRGGRLADDYADFAIEGFAWLEAADASGRALVDDVIDTLRVLRAADALRQRGTTLKTSANNEIFVDQRNATAIFALRLDRDRLYLLETADPTSSGEANLSSSDLDSGGNLRICFHHGRFKDDTTVTFAAQCAARIVADIHADTLGSFARPAHDADNALQANLDRAEIHLEAVDDNPDFGSQVQTEMARIDPVAASRIRVMPSLQAATPVERARYLAGATIAWDIAQRGALLDELAKRGHRVDGIDPRTAFEHVHRIDLSEGATLVVAATSAGFVYIPLGAGLRGQPLGGYAEFDVAAFTPVGVTGVVRGAVRNATVFAVEATSLLAIPRDVYLAHWHRTYDVASFAALFSQPR